MENWPVLPHCPLEQLSPRVRRVEGDLEGMPLKRVMTIARTASGKLVVHNAMALDDAGMTALDAFGPVGWVVVPNGYHRIDAPRFARRYPDAKVLCPPGARAKVERVVRVDGTYADFPEDPHVRFEVLDGTREGEGVMIVTDEDGTTLVFNDAIFNMPHVTGFSGFVFKHLTQSSGGPRVSRIARLFLVAEKASFRAHLQRLANVPNLRRVIVSHHETITNEPTRVLREVAASL
jgi:hypothetical protein